MLLSPGRVSRNFRDSTFFCVPRRLVPSHVNSPRENDLDESPRNFEVVSRMHGQCVYLSLNFLSYHHLSSLVILIERFVILHILVEEGLD